MAKKFILTINDSDIGKICYRGEGTREQILGDIDKLDGSLENLEVIPVVGGRFQKESLLFGGIIGASITGLLIFSAYKLYENLRNRQRKQK